MRSMRRLDWQEGDCDYGEDLSGNIKHFPKKPFVVTPVEMLRIIHETKFPTSGLLSEPKVRYGNNEKL